MQSPLFSDRGVPTVHQPKCLCPCGPVYDFQLKEFSNGTLHVYRYCKCCGERAASPVKRQTISLSKWRELLRASGREVSHG